MFRTFTPIPLLLDREQGFKINAKELRKARRRRIRVV